MTTDSELLAQIAANTRAISQLLALSLPKGFTNRLMLTFETEAKRSAYLASDGERSAREVARLAGTTHPTVGRWWDEWKAKGLVIEGEGGRAIAAYDLSLLLLAESLEFGLRKGITTKDGGEGVDGA